MNAGAKTLPEQTSLWSGQAFPMENSILFDSHNLDQIHEHMSDFFCPHELKAHGKVEGIHFKHHFVRLNSLDFNLTSYGHTAGKIEVVIPPTDNQYLIQFSVSGSATSTTGNNSFDISPGQIFVLDPNKKTRQYFNTHQRHFTLKVPRTLLEATVTSELGFFPEHFMFFPQPVCINKTASSLVRLIQTVSEDIDCGGSAYTQPKIGRLIEETLLRLLITTLPHTHSDRLANKCTALLPKRIKRVEEFLRTSYSEEITIADMIAISEASARSLYAGFRKYLHTTPMEHLKTLRLEQARSQLKTAMSDGRSVTDVAFNCGFNHLSKFARDYHKKFGEKPSETLRKPI